LIIPWVLHRDPRFFEDPETFRPERWSNGYMESLPRYAYIPFGAGQRVCIGSSFAQMEAALIMTSIAQRFDLQLEDPSRDVEPWPVVTLRTRADVPMRIIARNQQVQA
jgi:cytochrome P450